VLPATLEKTMLHHALTEPEQHDYQDDYKQKLSDFAPQ